MSKAIEDLSMKRWQKLCKRNRAAHRDAEDYLYSKGGTPTMERMIEYGQRLKKAKEIDREKEAFLQA